MILDRQREKLINKLGKALYADKSHMFRVSIQPDLFQNEVFNITCPKLKRKLRDICLKQIELNLENLKK